MKDLLNCYDRLIDHSLAKAGPFCLALPPFPLLRLFAASKKFGMTHTEGLRRHVLSAHLRPLCNGITIGREGVIAMLSR